jgi:nitrate/nitrite transport system permease protein
MPSVVIAMRNPEPEAASSEPVSVQNEASRASSATSSAPPSQRVATVQGATAKALLLRYLPPLLGYLGLIAVWALAAQHAPYLPGPVKTWHAAVTLFSDPFYVKGPNDVGVGWLLLNSLKRVAQGFGLAIAVGVPLGFLIGRFLFLNRAMSSVIGLLRPVSPLAWLPIGLAVFKAADPSAIFVIFITSIWPMVMNTALGVASVPQDYLNVARVLRLSEWKVFTKILFPATLPYMMTGMRLGLSTAWLVIVAAEMLTGGIGIGFWIWDEWNNLNMEHIIIAIFIVGFVGMILEQGMSLIARRLDYRTA